MCPMSFSTSPHENWGSSSSTHTASRYYTFVTACFWNGDETELDIKEDTNNQRVKTYSIDNDSTS
jgi:hypothetical protein